MPGEIDRVFYHHGGDLSGSVEIRLVMAYPQITTDSTDGAILASVDVYETVRGLASGRLRVTHPVLIK